MTRPPKGDNPFYHELVLCVVAMAKGWISARKVSELTGLSYKQTIDSLNYLYNTEKVARSGRKSTAKWGDISLLDKKDMSEESEILARCFLRSYMTP
ncbi:hypothetical protein [Flavobacterium sp.]|jgi:hypothetical protein|uniref:hypothetical protein n=1 Tax=Flavobacterium sp. TaxID=239 RepID=UPI0037C17FDA